VSTPEQMPFATLYGATTTKPVAVSCQIFAGLCELARLNMDTCRFMFSGAALHWERVVEAQTPEQFVRHQADTLPWLATQLAGYTRGWMDLAAETTAKLIGTTNDHHDDHARNVNTTLDGMARCASGVDAMLRALNVARGEAGAATARSLASPEALPATGPARDATLRAPAKRRRPSAEGGQSSR
jgi:hypothetical protein